MKVRIYTNQLPIGVERWVGDIEAKTFIMSTNHAYKTPRSALKAARKLVERINKEGLQEEKGI